MGNVWRTGYEENIPHHSHQTPDPTDRLSEGLIFTDGLIFSDSVLLCLMGADGQILRRGEFLLRLEHAGDGLRELKTFRCRDSLMNFVACTALGTAPQIGRQDARRGVAARRLLNGEEARVLHFLSLQPLKNVVLIGFIRDHGLESPRHRGTFYGCFRRGRLSGVALIGRHVLLSGDAEAAAVFADVGRLSHGPEIHLLLGESEAVAAFCPALHLSPSSLDIDRAEVQILYALSSVGGKAETKVELRRAWTDELEAVAQSHARFCLEKSGVDPMAQTAEGFRQRDLRRIELGRVWVAADARGIAFKADVVSETDEAVYLEGVWTRPDLRGAGLGRRAMKELCRQLLGRSRAVCLFADADDRRAVSFYRGIGFEPLATYHAVHFHPAHSRDC